MLHVLASFFGPIFAKELIEMARRKRYYFNRLLYGFALLLALYFTWETYRWYGPARGGGATIRAQAEMAEHFAVTVLIIQFAAVFVFVPLFLCGTIASEREEHTLDLLRTTRLCDRDIVMGKLGSRMAALLFLVLSGLPVLSLIMFFGGVDPLSLAMATAATVGALLFVGAHAIYFSAISKTPTVALVRTYWWLALELVILPYAVLLPVFAILMEFVPALAVKMIAEWILALGTCIHPVGPFVVAIVPEAHDIADAKLGEWFFPFTLVLPAGLSCLLIWLTVRSLYGDPRPLSFRIGRFDPLRWLRDRLLWPFRRLQASLDRRREPFNKFVPGCREVGNPLWQRSRYARVYDRDGHIGRIQWAGWIFAWFFIFLIGVCEPRALEREAAEVFLPIAWIAVAGLTAIFAGCSLVGDRRRGFLDQMLLTPLSAREIIDGTLLAVWQHMARLFWLPWLLGLFFALTGGSWAPGMLCSLITAALFCTLIALHGVLCSLTARTLPGALVPTFVFPLVVTLGNVLVLLVFEKAHAFVLWFGATAFLFGAVFAITAGRSPAWSLRLRWLLSAPRSLVTSLFKPVSNSFTLLSALPMPRRSTTLAVSSFFVASHLVAVSVATCWLWIDEPRAFPGLAMNPAFWVGIFLERHAPHGQLGDVCIPGVLCYWFALAVHFVWMRAWMIRNFDRLVGRTDQRTIAVPLPSTLEDRPIAHVPSEPDMLAVP
jgi:ABC-type transport system involved in multi-copper enzyme maturation permease subunit